MKRKWNRLIPLIITVGQVVVFPYYVIWLKGVSLTFTLFAWLFATHSFSAAWGYRTFQTKKNKQKSHISFVYFGMGCAYLVVGQFNIEMDLLPYIALILQVLLGFLQGYFRAWHVEQDSYHLHAVNHYILVGWIMISLSFIKIISPVVIISMFGWLLCGCGLLKMLGKNVSN
ncbi:hypothetical protein [Rummeliibacillus sp. POC4]|uniref:hypothetical protein n=1 Tax=Rummeliibacillus sp. POC4 TaxID=2305899 RepID=UPI000E65F109|nr:hypothetical protein [Rummeliibacillus sp. POC4]RIJ66917.1 hypothetical protein D1606_05280 [Rummeliibacillus sp. POC4]